MKSTGSCRKLLFKSTLWQVSLKHVLELDGFSSSRGEKATAKAVILES